MRNNQSVTLLFLSVLAAILCACANTGSSTTEIVIAIQSENVSSLTDPDDPEPMNTGIPSLDDLNREWNVQQMVAVYPDVSPDDQIANKYGLTGVFTLVVPKTTNISAMIEAYKTNPHIEYAERNTPVEIK